MPLYTFRHYPEGRHGLDVGDETFAHDEDALEHMSTLPLLGFIEVLEGERSVRLVYRPEKLDTIN